MIIFLLKIGDAANESILLKAPNFWADQTLAI